MPDMRALLGIGNPGREYAGTRHNLGFEVLDRLAARHGLGPWVRRWEALACEWPAAPGGRVLLLKPQTYVNLSGTVAQAWSAFFKQGPEALLVVVDDCSLALGTLRFRSRGSAGGHNGLKDIESRIGQGYPRLRLGIGLPPPGMPQEAFVLARFAAGELAQVELMLTRAVEACATWLADGDQGLLDALSRSASVPPPVA